MTPQLWIGLVFALVLMGFLITAFFTRPEISSNQHSILQFLSSLCAGCAGGFITGGALFQYEKEWPDGGKIAFTGVAGFALFGLIWLTYPRYKSKSAPPSLTVGVENGWHFDQAAHIIAQREHGIVRFIGFRAAEKNAILMNGVLRSDNAEGVLRKLGGLSTKTIRPYTVKAEDGCFILTIQ